MAGYDDGLKASLEAARSNYNGARRERNVALLTDFASMLASAMARSRGARYSVSTNNSKVANERMKEAYKRLSQAQRDYKGRIAMVALKKRGTEGNTDNVTATRTLGEGSMLHRPLMLKPGLSREELRLFSPLGKMKK